MSAASEEIHICTSFSIACFATSFEFEIGAISTSKPKSANELAITQHLS